jgi:hypothetical protein
MTNADLLKKKIEERGVTQEFIRKELGISRFTWYKKRDGLLDFKASEIQILCRVLGITALREKEQIFFAKM